ncbi:AGAP011225-PA-like protein [Anopheles sinensis]|uniref:AGAP011225-PA-like protein n=1 Tax=Anopheles sinensis TaxID=74873 RepID=A0A084W3U5_ANOSI|nr:AGAP011225-PA-like protein [Anopheles sinensis]
MISSKLRTLENNLTEIEDDLKTRDEVIFNSLVGLIQFVQAVTDAREQKLSTNVVNLNTKLQKIEANLVELATNISQYKRLSTAMAASEEPYASCLEEPSKKSGKYSIQIGPYKKAVTVYCEQTDYGGGWTVLQHRFDGSENFFRNWSDYRNGFGNLDGEFWLGLEHLYQMTSRKPHELMIEMKDFEGNYGYARYDLFKIKNERRHYALKNIGTYSGTAGDPMSSARGYRFSTPDRDNDLSEINCAAWAHGGWWWQYCNNINLNGDYMDTGGIFSRMTWFTFKNGSRSLKYSRMMVRENTYNRCT